MGKHPVYDFDWSCYEGNTCSSGQLKKGRLAGVGESSRMPAGQSVDAIRA
jgi:hypothetical protein